jgi:hypothetical protein
MGMSQGGYGNAFRSILKKLRDAGMYIDGNDGEDAGSGNDNGQETPNPKPKKKMATPRKRGKHTTDLDEDDESPTKKLAVKEEVKEEIEFEA